MAVQRPREGGLRRGEIFWLRLTTASAQCLGAFFIIIIIIIIIIIGAAVFQWLRLSTFTQRTRIQVLQSPVWVIGDVRKGIRLKLFPGTRKASRSTRARLSLRNDGVRVDERTLINKTTELSERDYIVRVLYKYSYYGLG